jgi:hypothetical protein
MWKSEKIPAAVLTVFSLLMIGIYVLESRIYHPFNFLKTYAGFRPDDTVRIAPACWFLFTGILFLSFALALIISPDFFRRFHDRFIRVGRRRFLAAAMVAAFGLSTLVNFLVYDNIPKNLDEIGYLFQAHHFASGKIYSRAPLEGFQGYMNIVTDGEGKIYGAHFPGMSLLQTPAVFIGQPWLTGPFLGALGLLVLFGLARRIYGEALARYALILALISPFYIFMSATFMSHPGTAFLSLLFSYFFVRWVLDGKKYAPYLTGLCFGLLAVTRPLTCLTVTLPFLIYLVVLIIKRRSSMAVPLFRCLLPVVIILVLFAGYVKILTGDPLLLPTSIQNPSLSPGFGPQKGVPVRGGVREPFYFADGLNQALSKTVMLGVDLYGWAGFSLVFIPFVLAAPGRSRWDIIFLSSAVLITVNYLVMPAKGMIYGPRYFFAAVPFLFLLTLRGIQGAAALLSKIHENGVDRRIYRFCLYAFALFVFLFTIRSALEYVPMKVEKYRGIQPRFLLDLNNIKF